MAEETVTIERLGARGDGVAPGPLFVAGALPGERVTIVREGQRGRLVAVEEASPERVEPFCPYFGRCGGCAAQHMGPDLYRSWKQAGLAEALRAAGLATPLDPLRDAHGEGRRRVTFHAREREDGTAVGYMAARSHDLVPIDHCPISEPALVAAPEIALRLARVLARSRKPLDLQVTATEAGHDVDIRGHGPAGERVRQALVAMATGLDLARLSLHGDVLVERRVPRVAMGRAGVTLAPGGFLQATRAGEETLAGLVRESVGPAKRVADLFAGCGPFALRLAEGAEVHAVEQDAAALLALDRAARGTPGLRRVTTEARDLFRRPLLPPELDRFDAVVLDPPRAGAEAQARQIAASKLPLVVSVSCDAGTFARDAAILVAAGYVLERVVPVDQFKWSPHLEIVGVLRRETARKRRPKAR